MTKAPDRESGTLVEGWCARNPLAEARLSLLGQAIDDGHDLGGERVAVCLGRAGRRARRYGNRLADGDDVSLAPAPLPPLRARALDVLGPYDGDRNDRRPSGEGHVGDATLRLAATRVADDLALDVHGDGAVGVEDFDRLLG